MIGLHPYSFARAVGALLLVTGIVACGKQDADAPPIAMDPADAPATEPTPPAPSDTDMPEDGPATFDLSRVPVSTVPLGEFPYFSIPEGYLAEPRHITRQEFGEAVFWVGDRFERIEGEVYSAGIRVDRDSGKAFSDIEVARNLEHVIKAAGGVEVASGEIPKEMRQDEAIESLMRQYHTEAKCWDQDPVQVFVVRRQNANIWVRTCRSQRFAGLIVAEEQAFVATAKLLPADALKEQLDATGRVAIEVNFATDKADILPDSQPQIEQVVALLEKNPALRLSVNGHTDDTGNAAHNQSLSEARAQSVVSALNARGINASRLQAHGFGQSDPVSDNATAEGKAKNRRVELIRLD